MRYRTAKYTVCRRVRASFSPEVLQAGAVKRLTVKKKIMHINICLPSPQDTEQWSEQKAGRTFGGERNRSSMSLNKDDTVSIKCDELDKPRKGKLISYSITARTAVSFITNRNMWNRRIDQ